MTSPGHVRLDQLPAVSGPYEIFQEELGEGRGFLACSPAMVRLRQRIEQVAGIDVPLLFLGESGVGKEVAARLAHRLSPRKHRTFLKINCAALPAELLESELFGYEPGAFTGASHPKPGKFEQCDGGTIFLDEIGELPTALQAKLLQVLEDRQFSRLGGRKVITVNVRILAATNLDMRAALAARRFREDLFYRLSTVSISIPALRERQEEIVPLLEYFRRRLEAQLGRPTLPFPPEVLESCRAYHWPGNVRELQNFVKRFVILGGAENMGTELAADGPAPAPAKVLAFPAAPAADLKATVRQLKSEAETRMIVSALQQASGNRPAAARALGISTKALVHKMQQYGIRSGTELGEGDSRSEASFQTVK